MRGSNSPGYVCLAVYRPQRDLLVRQIASLKAQTEAEWRCLIGIDGSDPTTRDMVDEVIAGDDRFIVKEFSDNVGFYKNFERLLQAVPEGSPWVALSDQDDEWFPEKLSLLIPALESASLVIGQVVVARADGTGQQEVTHRRAVSLAGELIDNQVTGSACVFRGSLLDVALPFPVPTELAFHDHWLGVCALAADGIAVVEQPTQLYLQHAANVIGEERASTLSGRVRKLVARSGGGVGPALRYLREHRWGWRVNMARALEDRDVELDAAERTVVAAFSRGRLSPVLLRIIASAVRRGQAPSARAVGLLLGASVARR